MHERLYVGEQRETEGKGSRIVSKLCSFNFFQSSIWTRYLLGNSKIRTIGYWNLPSDPHYVYGQLIFPLLILPEVLWRHLYMNLFSALQREESEGVIWGGNGKELSISNSLAEYRGILEGCIFILENSIIIFRALQINLFQYCISRFSSTKVALYFENICDNVLWTRLHNILVRTSVCDFTELLIVKCSVSAFHYIIFLY